MCQGRNPGQIRHGDKTVPCCQLMGAKSKPSWLYLRKLIPHFDWPFPLLLLLHSRPDGQIIICLIIASISISAPEWWLWPRSSSSKLSSGQQTIDDFCPVGSSLCPVVCSICSAILLSFVFCGFSLYHVQMNFSRGILTPAACSWARNELWF